ncbi:monocarboxylate transporter 12 isoform X2 [Teleopsis dalmanni]|uniref:monocarboxylate transporter 12 isoform X2 n=1 Tax=Teleopsis dalmanni TaxID=139649 RepID=UPI0018CD2CA0|nr:monocarboxylate transporter 12 isoform X2 [Teleopsis dalmanni]
MVHGPPARRKSQSNGNGLVKSHCDLVEDTTINQPIPPDGGWGWMVVFGSFMIHIITDGMTYSFGLFYNEFLNYFNEGKGYTAWIVSIMVGVTFASGPISSSFVNRYGCRAVTIAGSILAAICIILSVFAQNVATLIITIGFGTGLGLGLIYLPAIVSVTTYFDTKRSLATGIAVCGSGFGTFVFAPLTEHLINAYGWRGAMLIIGGIVLNCIIFGAMFRPLEPPKPPKSKKTDLIDNNTTVAELKPLKANGNVQPEQYLQLPENGKTGLCRSNSMVHTYQINHGSLLNIPEYARSRTDINGSGTIRRYGSLKHSTHISHSQENEKCCGCVSCSQETRDTLTEMMNFSLLKDVIFLLFAASNFCTSIGFNMPYVYIVSQAETLKLDSEQSSYLIATIGIANTVGRIILGYISDKPWVNRLWVYNVCLTICGIATALCPLCTDINSLMFYCAVFGFTIGAYVGLTSVILVDLLGLDKLTNAFGLLLLFQGVASFIGPPIGGWLYDITESFGPAFIMAGVMIAISGVMLFAIPPIQRYNERKAEQINAQQLSLS